MIRTGLPRIAIRLALIASIALVPACASSRQAAYEKHLSTVVVQGPAPSDAIAAAFGLDRYAITHVALSRQARTEN